MFTIVAGYEVSITFEDEDEIYFWDYEQPMGEYEYEVSSMDEKTVTNTIREFEAEHALDVIFRVFNGVLNDKFNNKEVQLDYNSTKIKSVDIYNLEYELLFLFDEDIECSL